jgi:hypothetical protein
MIQISLQLSFEKELIFNLRAQQQRHTGMVIPQRHRDVSQDFVMPVICSNKILLPRFTSANIGTITNNSQNQNCGAFSFSSVELHAKNQNK